ncbi:MAG: aspartate aminotransferase family protein, partial [Planctomycetota bacterium]
FFAGAGVLNYGHNNPVSKQALLDYIQRDGVQHGLDTATSAKVDFLQAFDQVVLKPRNLNYKVQFAGPTGTNSVEAAIKLARKHKQRPHVVAFTNAYHGHTLGALALTGNEYYHDPNYGSRNNVTHLPFDGYLDGLDSIALFEKLLDDPSSGLPVPAAVIFEPIQCEGGINVASNQWMQRLAAICKERDILLIADDIQVGNGRTGDFFSFEAAGIVPDMVGVSKSIGAGLPMSLVLISPECDAWRPGEHTGTFRGNNLAFVASAAMINEYWRDDALSKQTHAHGELIEGYLDDIAETHNSHELEVRGRGMVWGLDVHCGETAGEITKLAFTKGLIIETAGAAGNVIKLLPPLVIETSQLMDGLNILRECCDEVMGRKTNVVPPIQISTDSVATAKQG